MGLFASLEERYDVLHNKLLESPRGRPMSMKHSRSVPITARPASGRPRRRRLGRAASTTNWEAGRVTYRSQPSVPKTSHRAIMDAIATAVEEAPDAASARSVVLREVHARPARSVAGMAMLPELLRCALLIGWAGQNNHDWEVALSSLATMVDADMAVVYRTRQRDEGDAPATTTRRLEVVALHAKPTCHGDASTSAFASALALRALTLSSSLAAAADDIPSTFGAHTSLAAAALPAPGAAPLGVLQVMRSPPHGAPPRPFSAEVRGALRVLAVCAASSLRKAVADMPGQALAARTLPGPTPGHEQTPSPAPAPPLAAARGPRGDGGGDDDGDSDDGRVNVRTVATRLDDLQRKVEADKEPDASAVALREVAERQTAVVATLIQAWRRGALMADGPHGAAAPDGAAPFGARRPWSALSQPEWSGQPAPQLAPDGRRAALLRRRAQIVARLEAIERLQRTRSAAEARQSIRALTDPLPSAA